MLLKLIVIIAVLLIGVWIGYGIARRRHRITRKLQCKILGIYDRWRSAESAEKVYFFKLQHPDGSIFLEDVYNSEAYAYKVGDYYTVEEHHCEFDRTELVRDMQELLTD